MSSLLAFGIERIFAQADIVIFGAIGKAGHAIGFLFIGLDENALAIILQAVADFAF